MITLAHHVIDRAGFALHLPPGTLEIFAKPSFQIQEKRKKKVLLFKSVAPGTVPFGKATPGYCITFIKSFD